MKKAVAMLLSIVLTVGLLAGCGGQKEPEKEPDNETVEIPEDAVLTVGIPQNANVTDYENNEFTKLLESKLGRKIKFEFYASSAKEYKQQIALVCGAGNEKLPDVLLGLDLGQYVVNQYGEDGYFIDLTDYIEKYAVNYKKALDGMEENLRKYVKEKAVNPNDGAIYAMPRVLSPASDDLQSYMFINKVWLDKLGLDIPKTVEELRNVLQAFKTQDPNGNGEADEVPLLGPSGVQQYIINAFEYYDSGRFSVADGKVYDPVVTDEFRQALIYGRELVKDELYSSLSFTIKSNAEYQALISPADGPCKVGVFQGYPQSKISEGSEVIKDFIALPSLGDATGKGGYTIVKERNVAWTGFITEDCQYPELAMKFLDLFYDDEVVTAQRHGKEGVDWENVEGESYMGEPAHIKTVNTQAFTKGSQTWCLNALGAMTPWNYIVAIDKDHETRAGNINRMLSEQWQVQVNGKQAKDRAIYMVYTAEEHEVQEQYSTPVSTYINESITKFFAGENDPANDADWNEYLKNLESVGRSQLLKVAESSYGRK